MVYDFNIFFTFCRENIHKKYNLEPMDILVGSCPVISGQQIGKNSIKLFFEILKVLKNMENFI